MYEALDYAVAEVGWARATFSYSSHYYHEYKYRRTRVATRIETRIETRYSTHSSTAALGAVKIRSRESAFFCVIYFVFAANMRIWVL